MFSKSVPLVAAATCCLAVFSPRSDASPAKPQGGEADMAAMMAKAKKFTEPSKHHKELERFLGKWKTSMRLIMGTQSMPPTSGTAEGKWAFEGRWLELSTKGSMMGKPYESKAWTGYDNFKKSFVVTAISTMDTAMIRSEGDMDPGGKSMLLYGTLDEYLTGEHDKMVKTVWRFLDADTMIMEVHDLPIGEKNTKVVEIKFERAE